MYHLVQSAAGIFLALIATQQVLLTVAFAAESKHPLPLLPENAIGAPLSLQEEHYSCGPAALRSVLQYFGVFDGREQELYKLLETSPEQGTLPEKLAEGARHFGLSGTTEMPMNPERLRSHLAAGNLVILELQAWRDDDRTVIAWERDWDDGHYVVLIAMDAEYAYFMDPSTGDAYTYMPLGELHDRWHDINEVRKDPKEQRDFHLGVIISGKTPATPKLTTRRLSRLD